jgi:hypothetical protein
VLDSTTNLKHLIELSRVEFSAKPDSNHTPDLLSLFPSQCSHTFPNLLLDIMDAYTTSTGVIAYALIYKMPREHKLPLFSVFSSAD